MALDPSVGRSDKPPFDKSGRQCLVEIDPELGVTKFECIDEEPLPEFLAAAKRLTNHH